MVSLQMFVTIFIEFSGTRICNMCIIYYFVVFYLDSSCKVVKTPCGVSGSQRQALQLILRLQVGKDITSLFLRLLSEEDFWERTLGACWQTG